MPFYTHNRPYPLDNITGCQMAVSCRKLKQLVGSNYYGRVRRSSDNTESNLLLYTDQLSAKNPLENGDLLDAFISSGNGFTRRFFDQSGNANHGEQTTAASQPQFSANAFGKNSGVYFSGTQTLMYGTGLASTLFGSDKKFTVIACIKNDLTLNTQSGVFFRYINTVSGVVNGFDIALMGSAGGNQSIQVRFGNGTNDVVIATSSIFVPGIVMSIAVLYDGSIDTAANDRVTLYVNGVQQTTTRIAFNGTFPFDIGTATFQANTPFSGNANGYIAETMVFNKLLSADERTQLYKDHKTYFNAA